VKYILSLICLLYSHCAFSVIDDSGNTISLSKPAIRVISLAPNITETLFAIGGGDKLVGVIRGSDYPAAALAVPQVGSYLGLDVEKIISLHPDLIVTWGNAFSRQLAILKKMGVPIYQSTPHELQDVPRLMRHLGELLGMSPQAEKVANDFAKRLRLLQQRHHPQTPVTVFYQIGAYSLITINRDSWINQIITLCGGKNSYADAHTIAPEVSWESVVVVNPQVIINDSTDIAWKRSWQAWPMIAAVKNHRLYTVNPDLVERLGPRTLEGVVQVCNAIK